MAVCTVVPEAKGHGARVDHTFLTQLLDAGNAAPMGKKSRLGHPKQCSEAMGTYLGRVSNFRMDGDILRGDLKFDKTAYATPNGDLATYLMDLAESDPEVFGTSICVRAKREHELDMQGQPVKDKDGNTMLPCLRLESHSGFFGVDVVDDPAANPNGLFGNAEVGLSAEVSEAMDRLLASPDFVERALVFLEKVRAGFTESSEETSTNKENDTMEFKDITVENLSAERPDIIEAIKATVKPETVDLAAALEADRKRVASIMKHAKPHQFKSGLVDELVMSGADKGDALEKILEDVATGKNTELNNRINDSENLGGKPAPKQEESKDPKVYTDFMEAVADYAKEKSVDEYTAMLECRKLYPELHKKMQNVS